MLKRGKFYKYTSFFSHAMIIVSSTDLLNKLIIGYYSNFCIHKVEFNAIYPLKNPSRAAQDVSAGRIWPAGRTLGTTVVTCFSRCMLVYKIVRSGMIYVPLKAEKDSLYIRVCLCFQFPSLFIPAGKYEALAYRNSFFKYLWKKKRKNLVPNTCNVFENCETHAANKNSLLPSLFPYAFVCT